MRGLIHFQRPFGGPLELMRREMDDVFQRFFGVPLEGNGHEGTQPWVPQVDVEETDKEILVKADLPGVEPKDVEVSVAEGSLILKGEKKAEKEEKKKNYYRMERYQGSFYRAIPLPPGTDPDKIGATSSKGVVTITIPKKPEVMPKKIPVKPQT